MACLLLITVNIQAYRTLCRALEVCPDVLIEGLQKLSDETGWAWLAIGAGPIPNANGVIYKKQCISINFFLFPQTEQYTQLLHGSQVSGREYILPGIFRV